LTIDGEVIEIPMPLLRLYQDIPVRVAAQKLIEQPLQKSGIDSFEVRESGKPIITITKDEASYFSRPELPDETLVDEVRRSAYSIISLAFKEENKWRLNDGNNPISVAIDDSDFLARVDNNQVSFTKGDILICDVHIVQKRTDQGLRTEYTVIKVVDHRTAARQLPLPLFAPESGTTGLPVADPPSPAPPMLPEGK
jgi:hypothetical protein